jgi:DNA replication licensing factor MCM2
MSDQDRTSIHEAMEQQTISISKAGIVTTLQARASIVAAANPVKGNYDSTKTFHQNVQLSDPILSRFDILCVVRDMVDPIEDEKLATFVVNSHFDHHPNNEAEVKEKEQKLDVDDESIPQDLLKKYILYSKLNFQPKLTKINSEKLVQFYKDLRSESFSGGLPISVRHLESLFRLAEANARLHLRDFVREDDINTAISIMLDSFVSTQKHSVAKTLRKKFGKYLNSNHDQILIHLLQNCIREQAQITQEEDQDSFEIELEEFEARAKQYDIFNVHPFLTSTSFQNQFSFDSKKKLIKKIFVE